MSTSTPQVSTTLALCCAALVFAGALWALLAHGLAFATQLGPHGVGVLYAQHGAPAASADWIWVPLLLGLGLYALYQCREPQRQALLHYRIRFLVAAAALLAGLWLQLLDARQLGAALAIGLLLLTDVFLILRRISRKVLYTSADRWITRATMGLFFGTTLVMVLTNFTAWVPTLGVEALARPVHAATALLVLLTCLAVSAMTFFNPMGIYVNLGAAWMALWIAVAAYDGPRASAPVAICATIGTALLLICLLSSVRIRVRQLTGD